MGAWISVEVCINEVDILSSESNMNKGITFRQNSTVGESYKIFFLIEVWELQTRLKNLFHQYFRLKGVTIKLIFSFLFALFQR